jgi:dihydrolipoamide dehydrogenase
MLLQNRGLANLYADTASGLFLGAEIFAPAAEHLAHMLAWALQNKMSVAQMLEMPFYHPVIEEGLRSALQELKARLHAAQANAGKASGAAWQKKQHSDRPCFVAFQNINDVVVCGA